MNSTQALPVGMLFSCQDPPEAASLAQRWKEVLELAGLAEDSGFGSLHVSEHHMRADGYLPQPLIACAAIAAVTSRVLVGPTLMVAPLRHAVHLAEEAAVVDVLSGGRLVLGLGLGNFEPEYALFDIPIQEQVPRFEACLRLLNAAWDDEKTDDLIQPRPITPVPIQRPHPPLWVGAMSHGGAARAGRLGDALLLDPLNPITSLVPFVETYRRAATEAGRTPRVVLMRWGWIEQEPGDAHRDWWPHVEPALRTYLTDIPRFEISGDTDELALEAVSPDRLLVGEANELIDSITQWRNTLHFDHLVVKFQGETGPWGSKLASAIERFGQDVIGPLNGTSR